MIRESGRFSGRNRNKMLIMPHALDDMERPEDEMVGVRVKLLG